MVESGIIVFLAFWLLWIKIPIVTRLKLLGHPALLDLSVSALVFLMFGGTGEGLMAASLAAVIMSINISLARKYFGYYYRSNGQWKYKIGKFNQSDKIRAYYRRCDE